MRSAPFALVLLLMAVVSSGAQALAGFDGVNEYRAICGGAIPQIAGNVDTIAGAELTDITSKEVGILHAADIITPHEAFGST